jgi:hypothetical protein
MKTLFHHPHVATFEQARATLRWLMKNHSHEVHPFRWQGADVRDRPEMKSYELMNVSFTMNLQGVEDLHRWRQDIRPNLPWADNHFEERVCGLPLNPGVEWKNWPWATSADKFREPSVRVMGRDDWAYLAGIIDGEGSFSVRTANGNRVYPRIKITQVDEPFLRGLYEKWGVGTFREYSAEGNPLSDRQSHIWRISSKAEVRWVIDGCLPYLRLKRDRALECLEYLDPETTVYDPEPRFNHNYMMRYWPKHGGRDTDHCNFGIRNEYGDLNDLVSQLVSDPHSRQEWFPVFHPEDVGPVTGGRKPCSLGYHFMRREDRLHVYYPLRSCDLLRHWADDCYLTVRLLLWVLEKCREKDHDSWKHVNPGAYTMHMTSLHIFANDWRTL